MSNKILIVDDSTNLRRTVERNLSRDLGKMALDVTFMQAGDGLECLYYAGKYQPSLIIIDLEMPNLNGLDTIAKLRKLYFPGEIVILTGKPKMGEFKEAQRLKIKNCMVKPFNSYALTNMVYSILKHDGLSDAK
jgi:CheY-like chemotaxis protein